MKGTTKKNDIRMAGWMASSGIGKPSSGVGNRGQTKRCVEMSNWIGMGKKLAAKKPVYRDRGRHVTKGGGGRKQRGRGISGMEVVEYGVPQIKR